MPSWEHCTSCHEDEALGESGQIDHLHPLMEVGLWDGQTAEVCCTARAWLEERGQIAPLVVEVRDDTVRLHGGPAHGRIVTVPRRLHYLAVPPPVPPLLLKPPDVAGPPPEPVVYSRARLAWYDEILDVLWLYDYWHTGPLPPLPEHRLPRRARRLLADR